MTQKPNHLRIACLLFGSGLCALVYQTVWLREFRLIFGASTAASAAVLGIFMGGLGLGSAILGKRAEGKRQPLGYYANLEILIAISAALTPLIFWLVRMAYTATGGSPVLGHTGATVVRLLLASVVLAVPTFLMGGTLPAAARAAESEDDHGRRNLALLYGCNTLGAVFGAVLSTFFLIEHLGNRQTLWLACGLNLLVAMIARVMSRSLPEVAADEVKTDSQQAAAAVVPWKFTILASAGVGWAFMLMELVWYRMLSPILGGSTFTFGLILAVALLGIGLGGALYALLRSNKRPSANGFAATCGIEALCIAIPFALGDRLAMLALQLRGLSVFGFEGHLLGWAIVTSIVVLPAAIVAGYQFPMLIALLGSGREGVGRETGLTYAANTVGAIAGSLGGGFGLLPLLTAQGAWILVVVSLAALALLAIMVGRWQKEPWQWTGLAAAGTAAVLMFFCMGPTAAWRHSGVGAGRSRVQQLSQNAVRDYQHAYRHSTVWEADGVESSVALAATDSYAFVVNGKVDGNSRGDSGTQIMSGILGALSHPNPKRAMVIGLGTGSTAGWLAAIPGMERVDVVELEEVILHVADKCSPVNQDVLKNPKVRIHIGDAREALLASSETYDIIFSEPSNPYRAGIASLFSQDFYQSVQHRLSEGGIFLQWTQLYDVDAQAVQTVFATLGSVFPSVETWHTQGRDIVLLASKQPIVHDVTLWRKRIAEEPYRAALLNAWRVDSVEGIFSHFLVGDGMARLCIASGAEISTDDRSCLEFGFARGVGRGTVGDWNSEIADFARSKGWHRPRIVNGEVDWELVDLQFPSQRAVFDMQTPRTAGESPETGARKDWFNAAVANDFKSAAAIWKKYPFKPASPIEAQLVATMMAEEIPAEAGPYLDALRKSRPTDGDALQARMHATAKQWEEATALLEKVFVSWRKDPWAHSSLVQHSLKTSVIVVAGANNPAIADRIYASLREPFSVYYAELRRREAAMIAARASGPSVYKHIASLLEEYEPNIPWNLATLQNRAKAYQVLNHPRLAEALNDLVEFKQHESPPFATALTGGQDATLELSREIPKPQESPKPHEEPKPADAGEEKKTSTQASPTASGANGAAGL